MDVTVRKIITVNAPEAAPAGDAMIAGVGSGVFSSLEEVAERAISADRIYNANDANHKLYEKLFNIYEEAYDALLGTFDKLAATKEKFGITM